MSDEQESPLIDAFMARTARPEKIGIGARVRRRTVPTEPGPRAVGLVIAATMNGSRVFVRFGSGAKKQTVCLAVDELERA